MEPKESERGPVRDKLSTRTDSGWPADNERIQHQYVAVASIGIIIGILLLLGARGTKGS
jgi:hypothetical protein